MTYLYQNGDIGLTFNSFLFTHPSILRFMVRKARRFHNCRKRPRVTFHFVRYC